MPMGGHAGLRICSVDRGTSSPISTEPQSRIDFPVDFVSQGLNQLGNEVTVIYFGAG